jgi:hypothetical protein
LTDIDMDTARERPIQVSRLVAFKYNLSHTSLSYVVRRDSVEEFYMHKILEHRFTMTAERKLREYMEFLVGCLGYGPKWNSWKP